MYIKIFEHGTGSGNAPVEYLLDNKSHGRDKHPPEILRGNSDMTIKLINSIGNKWKYTAGVLSWHPDDKVAPEKERKLMDDFERLAFAGLEPDQYNILWVRHQHAGHHELHFVIPRVELASGKAYNPCPPGWQKNYDPLRDLYNYRENWARPDDPERARLHKPEHADLHNARLIRWGKTPKKDARTEAKQAIHDYMRQCFEQGVIKNRNDVIDRLQQVGLQINRAGKDYVTVIDPDSNEKLRLKGGIYAQQWLWQQPERLNSAHQGADRTGTTGSTEYNQNTIRALEQQFDSVIKKRADYNRKRYSGTTQELGKEHFHSLPRPQLDIRKALSANFANQRQHPFGHHFGRMDGLHPGGRQDNELIARNINFTEIHDNCRAKLPRSNEQIERHQPGSSGWQGLSSTAKRLQGNSTTNSGASLRDFDRKGLLADERNTATTTADYRQNSESNFRQIGESRPEITAPSTGNKTPGATHSPTTGTIQSDRQRATRIREKLRTFERYTQELGAVVANIEANIKHKIVRDSSIKGKMGLSM